MFFNVVKWITTIGNPHVCLASQPHQVVADGYTIRAGGQDSWPMVKKSYKLGETQEQQDTT